MNYLPVSPNVVPLLQGLKPYLGSKGHVLVEGVTSVFNLLGSSPGQEAVGAMSKVFTTVTKSDKAITVNTSAGPVTLSLNLAFTLFLILILLLLSGNLLAFGALNNQDGYYGSALEETGNGDYGEPSDNDTLV